MGNNETREQLAEYCTNLIEGYAWADTGEEAAEHIRSELGWRPPARIISDAKELDGLAFPCLIREEPTAPTDFYPQLWEMGFQTGWCRVGHLYDPGNCTPRLPVTVLDATEEAGR